jgi:hypothetical protein
MQMKLILITIGCGMFLTARAFHEDSPDDHMLQTVSFPKGGMIVWIAHLNDSIHAEGLAEKIAIVPVLPRIEISTDMTNDLVLAKWIVVSDAFEAPFRLRTRVEAFCIPVTN